MISEKSEIFPIAIGTYGLGAERTEAWTEGNVPTSYNKEHMKALEYSFEKGQNYIETSFIYAGGQTIKFLSDFFKRTEREKLFITVKLENFVEKTDDIETQLDKYLGIMGLEYADSFILHTPRVSKLPLDETYYHMSRMIEKGKTRFLSGSNLSIEQLRLLYDKCNFKLFSLEGLYNLECKVNEDVGILDFCDKNDIAFVSYQPLRRNRTANRNYDILVNLAKKYGKTQNQILLNWISKDKRLIPIIKSGSIEHVNENLSALDFNMDKEDIDTLNRFRSAEFDSLSVDWEDSGKGIPIYKYANQFP